MNTPQYRLMIYFAIGTLHLYRTDLVVMHGMQTPESFAQCNEAVLKRVRDEALTLFGYKLSSEQVGRAIIAYIAPGQSAMLTAPATL